VATLEAIEMSRSSQRIASALIGLVFIVAGAIKILDPASFAIDILNYRLLPWTWDVVLALYLPWLEVIVGGALLFHKAYRGALCVVAGLLTAFIPAYASTRPRGLDVACGCFGHGVHRGYWPTLIIDALMLALAVWLIRADSQPLSPVIRSTKQPMPTS
jgi:putative oxidoreductase